MTPARSLRPLDEFQQGFQADPQAQYKAFMPGSICPWKNVSVVNGLAQIGCYSWVGNEGNRRSIKVYFMEKIDYHVKYSQWVFNRWWCVFYLRPK